MTLTPAQIGLIGVLALLGIAFYSLLISRNLIKLIVALQILVKAVVLGLVAAGKASGQMALSESMAITVIVADTVVAVVALAIIVQIRRHVGTLDISELTTLRG